MKSPNILLVLLVAHTLLMGSAFAISSICPIVTSNFQMPGDYSGAPNSVGYGFSGHACVVISASNLVFDCNGHSITNDGTGGNTAGIYFSTNSLRNITIKNCAVSNYTYGMYLLYAGNLSLINNTMYNNAQDGVYFAASNSTIIGNNAYGNSQNGFDFNGWYGYCNNNLIANNTAYGNNAPGGGYGGFVFYNSSNNVLTNNTAFNNNDFGFDLAVSCSNNTFTGNTAYNNSFSGFYCFNNSVGNTMAGNTAYNNAHSGFESVDSSHNLTLINNTAYGNALNGFYILISANNTLANNTAYGNSYAGFNFYIATSSKILNNTAHDNGYYGFALDSWSSNNLISGNTEFDSKYGFSITHSSYSNNVTGNLAHDNSRFGFVLYNDSNWNTLTGNVAYNTIDPLADPLYGFGFNADHYSNANTFTGNTAYNSGQSGFYLKDNSNGNMFFSNIAYNSGLSGFLINSSNDTLMIGNEIRDNPGFGVQIINSSNNTRISWEHYYNNSGSDLSVDNSESPSEIQVDISNVLISNPAGNWDQTVLFLNDLAGPGEAYRIGWAAVPSELPPGFDSFFGKMLNVSVSSGAPSIDRISFGWADWELDPEWSPYHEAKLVLLKYNGTWSLANYTPDTEANILSQFNLASFSQFGIFEDIAPPEITIENPVSGKRYGTLSVALNYTVSNDLNLDRCWYVLNGVENDTAIGSCQNITLAGLQNGWNNLTVYANDHAGNVNSSTVAFLVGSTPAVPPLEVSVSSTCQGNIATVSSDGTPVGGARLAIGDSIYRTDSSGTAAFKGCGNTVTIHASKDGYEASDSTETLIPCAECAVPVQPPTPPTPPTPPGCRAPACCGSDSDCADNSKCTKETGASTGKCVQIAGCGLVANHALTPWECGGAGCPECAQGSSCTDHVCVMANVTQPPLVKPPVTEQPPITQAVSDNTLPILLIILLLILAIALYLRRKKGEKQGEAAPKKAKVVKPKDAEE